jgi:hypothetical protein
MGNYDSPLSMRVRAATGALIAGGMLIAGTAGIGFAAAGNNNGNHFGNIKHVGNGKHGGGNPGQGKGPGDGNNGGALRIPTDPGTPTAGSDVITFGGGSSLLLCEGASVLAESCPEDAVAD